MIRRNTIFFKFIKKCEMPPKESFFWLTMNLLFNSTLVLLGRFLLVLLKKKRKGSFQYVLMASKNMGDILFLYRSLDELKRLNCFNNIIIVADNMFRKPLEALGVKHFRIISFWKIMAMDKAVQLYPDRYKNIVVSQPWYFFGVRNINSNSVLRTLPCHASDETIRKLFPKASMRGNSVVLSPYEQTISLHKLCLPPWDFWTKLTDNLRENGFFVFTNCNGKTEKPIDGTAVFYPPLEELAGTVEYAGYCISLRSGFTDWISSAKLKKEVVLYPTKRFFEDYNINLLWDKKLALEYIYGESNINIDELINIIIKYLVGGENCK